MFGKIGMVILLVSDVHKLITFYRDALGMKVRHESDEWVELSTKEGSTSLALHLSQKVVKRSKASGANSRCENAYSVIRI